MSNGDERDDYEVGYGRPPKSGQFKKGLSGNPSGRPKKLLDFDSVLMRELNLPMVFHENGRRKKMTRFVITAKQMANKAASGDLRAARFVAERSQRVQERTAEQQKNAPKEPDRKVLRPEDLSDEDLVRLIGEHLKESGRDYSHISESLQQKIKEL